MQAVTTTGNWVLGVWKLCTVFSNIFYKSKTVLKKNKVY